MVSVPSRGVRYLNVLEHFENMNEEGFRPLSRSKVSELKKLVSKTYLTTGFRPLSRSKVSERLRSGPNFE